MAEQERGYLGMTHNPFAVPGDGFFERGDRKTHLEQLRHLSQWSRRVLLVTGPHDSGKSVLYQQLSASLEPRAKAARVNGAIINTSREILAAIAQGYGIAAPGNANTQLLTKLIAQHVEEQEASDRFCVTLIDDAEIIEPRGLDELMELVGQCSMRLVLFGEVRFVPLVERLAKRHEIGWHEIRLTGFSAHDAREYLEWRFQEARYRGRLPFTDQQVKEIVRLSEGLPGRINQMANVLMVKLESGDIGERPRFPALHKALLALLLVLVSLAYVLWQQDGEFDVIEIGVVATDEARPTTPQMPVPAIEPVLKYTDTPKLIAVATVVPEAGPRIDAGEDSTGDPSAEPTPEPEFVVAPAVVEPVIRPATISSPAPQDGSWLLQQPDAAFTIQLVTFSSAERGEAYLAGQHEYARFARYRFQRNGRVFHVVVFGIFDSRVEAMAAADRLPVTVGDVRPWVRPISQVKESIRAALAQQ
ncbi:MAG: AAA family ATPase [Gammaproteobacteria bacterium]|nr:AAA family ATPase [Gammaproteobacteria bacterium]